MKLEKVERNSHTASTCCVSFLCTANQPAIPSKSSQQRPSLQKRLNGSHVEGRCGVLTLVRLSSDSIPYTDQNKSRLDPLIRCRDARQHFFRSHCTSIKNRRGRKKRSLGRAAFSTRAQRIIWTW